ncbi:hypothetical protein HYT02_04165 [Candidatus Gottesmanbacteria bacterium]|nr:hypothetical protein [Candidatus Gottesmanbacteria bacterium]
MNKGKLVLGSLFILLLVSVIFWFNPNDQKLVMYFCDVGQGDSIYIRFPNGDDMLVDGGPGNKVLDCLAESMPFYDRHINVVVLTHPQKDHLGGLVPVIQRYSLDYYVSTPVGNNTDSYKQLKKLIEDKGITVKNLYAGSQIQFDTVLFKLFWPEKNWMATNVLGASTTTSDLNDFSVMGILEYGNFQAVLTGDGDIRIQDNILNNHLIDNDIQDIEVLKVPHHGSKTAMTDQFLNKIKPKLAVIMVGKNSYGHPSPEIIERLVKIGTQVKRTDIEGTIKIQSDGVNWTVGH